jgi:ribosomal protein S12 methylthiotransferase accessory factor
MDMEITFPGGLAVAANFKGFTVVTDQPVTVGGADSAPTPFDLFFSAIGTCGGLYALRFCQQRGLDTSGLSVRLRTEEEEGRVSAVRLEVLLPETFPEKYRDAIVRAVDHCTVKRHILEAPRFEITALIAQAAGVN